MSSKHAFWSHRYYLAFVGRLILLDKYNDNNELAKRLNTVRRLLRI